MNFLEFAVWGAYLTSLGVYLAGTGLGDKIYWFYTVQGIVSIFMPAIIGILADRYVQAQRMLSACHFIAGAFMCAAAAYCSQTTQVEFGPLFTLYTVSVAFYMPTIGLANSVAYTALNKSGLDTVIHFPPIRVFGTVGFIASMLLTNFLPVDGESMQKTYFQLLSSGIFSFILAVYALFMPTCPVNRNGGTQSVSEALGLKAFSLFKQKRMAIFFIFSMFLGVSLQITNSYGTTFINAFENVAQYADSWVAKNATALISLSQFSETLCILLIPYCLKKFGIKGVMLIAMFGWVLRFGFFGIGNPELPGVIFFILSCVVYGVAFDFFNISGSLYVDKQTDSSTRSSAQGLFMLMTNGVGATIGTLVAGQVVNHYVYNPQVTDQISGWETSWYIFAAYALVVAVAFWIVFRDDEKPRINVENAIDDNKTL